MHHHNARYEDQRAGTMSPSGMVRTGFRVQKQNPVKINRFIESLEAVRIPASNQISRDGHQFFSARESQLKDHVISPRQTPGQATYRS